MRAQPSGVISSNHREIVARSKHGAPSLGFRRIKDEGGME